MSGALNGSGSFSRGRTLFSSPSWLGAKISRETIQHPLEAVEIPLNLGTCRRCTEAEVVRQLELK